MRYDLAALLRIATRNARRTPRAWARAAHANLARLQRLEAAYEAGLLCDAPRVTERARPPAEPVWLESGSAAHGAYLRESPFDPFGRPRDASRGIRVPAADAARLQGAGNVVPLKRGAM